MKNIDYLARAAQLAGLADSSVGDNPRVGAVLVNEGRIIGEGYHQRAGEAHAEVNCLNSVRQQDRALIRSSTLYISLEPCCIKGRTPACTGLILKEKIKKVVFTQRDTSDEVSGRSAAILRESGVRVKEYPDFAPSIATNLNRFVYTTEQRPFILLKYARSADGFLRPKDRKRKYWITNELSRRLVHRWRTDTNAVIVGARTVIDDDPQLNSRLFPGPDPRPVVIDLRDRLTGKEKLFTGGGQRPLVFTGRKPAKMKADLVEMKEKELNKKAFKRILRKLHDLKFGHVTVEGGATTLSAFLEYGHWDEVRRFTGEVRFGAGMAAPALPHHGTISNQWIGGDLLETVRAPVSPLN